MTRLSRRSLLRGAGGVTVGLPWLEAMEPRRANAAARTRRLVFFFFSNGVITSKWNPTGSDTSFTLSPILSPFEPLKRKLVVLQGINQQAAIDSRPGTTHSRGMACGLVARRWTGDGWGSGISIDQHVGSRIGSSNRFPSLQYGVYTQGYAPGSNFGYISYAGPNKPIPSEDSPSKMFQRVFSAGGASAGVSPQTYIDRRKSILDFTLESYRRLGGRLGAADKDRLTEHLERIREIERGLLQVGATATAGCRKPGDPPAGANFTAAIGKSQMDQIVSAFACDFTRVATLQWSTGQSGVVPPGVSSPHPNFHRVSHQTDPVSVAALVDGETWYMQQLAYLAGAMDAIPDGPGATMLDNTAIVTISEQSVGWNHSFVDMPFVIVGGCGGSIRTGRYLSQLNRAHNDVWLSLMNAMGIAETTFGDPAYVRGPIPGLLA